MLSVTHLQPQQQWSTPGEHPLVVAAQEQQRWLCTHVRSIRNLVVRTWTTSSPCSWEASSHLSTGPWEEPHFFATASDTIRHVTEWVMTSQYSSPHFCFRTQLTAKLKRFFNHCNRTNHTVYDHYKHLLDSHLNIWWTLEFDANTRHSTT